MAQPMQMPVNSSLIRVEWVGPAGDYDRRAPEPLDDYLEQLGDA